MCVRSNTTARASNLTNFRNVNNNNSTITTKIIEAGKLIKKTAAELNILFHDNKMDTQLAVSAQITWQ